MKMRTSRKSFVVMLAVVCTLTNVHGQILTWDADPTTPGAQDGPGIWNTTTNTWWTGAANATWSSTIPNAATFGAGSGTAGTVTLGEPIVSGNIRFNAPAVGNYTIAGGGYTLGLTNRNIYPTVNATISADIVGTGITISHGPPNGPSGLLILSGNNRFGGAFTLGQNANNEDGQGPVNTTCAARITSSTALGTSTINFNSQGNATSPRLELVGGITVTNPITWQARNNVTPAFVSFSGANTLSGPITLAAGGTQYRVLVYGSSTLTMAGNMTIQTAGARTIVLDGTGTGTYSGAFTGGNAAAWTNIVLKGGLGTWTLSGPNTFAGSYGLSGGTLVLDYTAQNNAKLYSGCPLFLSGGTLTLNGGSWTETVSSNVLVAGASRITRASGSSTLRLNAISRQAGSTIDFAAAGIADTDSPNVNGILGGYATVAGSDWAINSTGGSDGPIGVYTGYTDIAATGSTINDNATSNVRLNSAGSGGNITLGSTTTTINTLLQNTTTAATVDTSSRTLRLGPTGGVLIPSGRAGLTIGTSPDAGVLTAGGSDNTPGEIILINHSAGPIVINSTITDNGSGAVSLTKSGSGSAILSGNNTHTGTNYIVGGTLVISNSANIGSGPVVINGGTLHVIGDIDLPNSVMVGPVVGYGSGTISVATNRTLTLSGVVSESAYIGPANAGTLVKTGPGTLVLASAGNTYRLGTVINEGIVRITTGAVLGGFDGPTRNGTFTCYHPENIVLDGGTLEADASFELGAMRGIRLGPIGGAGSGTISVTEYNTLTFNGQISDNWGGTGTLIKDGNGTLSLGGSVNDYSGNTIIRAGTLQLTHARALPTGPDKGNITNYGTLALNNVSVTLNRITSPGTIDHLGSDAVTLTIGANNTDDSVAGGINNSGGGPLTLVKAGSGTLTLGGTSSYSGATRITGGTLRLAAGASIGATTNIIVGAGAVLDVTSLSGATLTLNSGQTLSGSGTVQGSIADSWGAAIAPGTSAGTLTINGNLTLGGGGNLNFELANVTTPGSGVNDLLVVTGTLTVSGSTTLNLSYLQGVPAASGKYTLIQYGAFSGDVNSISVPEGFIITNNTAAKAVELVVVHQPVTLTWRGDGTANVWDTAITPNWLLGGSPQVFYTGDTAVFDDTGYNTPPINISGTVYPGATVVNASKDYTFSGGAIGSGALTKSGTGTLTLENDNLFNSVLINAGTVQIGSGGYSGTIAGGTITNNAALVVNRADAITVTNEITGSGTLKQVGSSQTVLTASNSYTGLTIVDAGTLSPRNSAALGTTDGGTIATNAGLLYLDANINFPAEPLTLQGANLRKGGAGMTVFGGPVTLVGDSTFYVDGNATLVLSNAAGVNGAAVNANLTLTGDSGSLGVIAGPLNLGAGMITKDGAGAWKLSGPGVFGGFTAINNGELIIGHPQALGSVTNLPVSTQAGGPGITGTRITVADGTAVSNVWVGLPSDASYRSALFSRGTGGVTNVWAGPIAFTGYEGTINFGTEPGAVFVIAGPITNDTFTGVLIIRGFGGGGTSGAGCTGIITAPIKLDPTMARVSVDDGSTWIIASTGNSYATNNITSGVLKLGAHNALPTSCALVFGIGGAQAETFDLAGFNQQLGAIDTLSITARIIGNSSTTSDSLLTLAGPNVSMFGGTIVDGIGEGTRRVALTLTGGATLTLTNVNTYSGDTTIGSGCTLLLAGNGSITNSANIVLGSGATLDVTGRPDGTLTVSPVQTLKGTGTFNLSGNLVNTGTIEMKVNKTGSTLTSDRLIVSGNITYGGTLSVVRSGDPLAVGDSFTLFSAAGASGNFASIVGSPGPGLGWNFNPASGVLSVVVGGPPTTPTNISYSVSAGNITLSWPASYIGWILQVQTNALTKGISTNWVDVPGSASTNQVVFPIGTTNGTVFFRLRYP